MTAERAVYDSDVQMNPILKAIAIQYVSEYNGNFEMMIGAKQDMHYTGTLPNSTTRAVLNTLRQENRPQYSNLRRTLLAALDQPVTTPPVLVQAADHVDPRATVTRPSWQGRQGHRKTPQDRPAWIIYGPKPLRAKFATTKHRAQKPVYHLLHSTCDVRWEFPRNHRGQLQKHQQRVFQIIAKRFCGGYPAGLRFWDHIPTDEEAWPGNDRNHGQTLELCTACRAAQERWSEL